MKSNLLILCLLICSVSYGQKYREMIAKGSYTVFQIQEEAKSYFESVGRDRGTGYKSYKRWEYNALRTMDESGILKSSRYYFDLIKKEELRRQSEASSRTAGTVGEWEELGPHDWNATSGWNPGVGRITAFAVDPDNKNHIVVGSQTGGVWKTTNEGVDWKVLTDNFTNLSVYSLAMHPDNTSTYFWGSSDGTIFKSTDSGENWEPLASMFYGYVNKILIDPTNTDKMYCSIDYSGIFKSTDGGDNWELIHPSATVGYDVVFKPGDTNTIYASGEHFFVSVDGGDTFTYSNEIEYWTQSHINLEKDWSLTSKNTSGLITSHSGNKLALFYDQGYNNAQTKLVSQALDLSGATNPQLKFFHTQEQWGGDQDELKVYYKISLEGDWNELAHYNIDINTWTEEIVTLPNPSSTYFIAFDAKANYGYGVTLDDITIEDEKLGVVLTEGFENNDYAFETGAKMIGVSNAAPNTVYVLEADNNRFGAFYKSENSGANFQQLDHTGYNYFGYASDGFDDRGQAPRDMAIAVNPSNADEVHIAGILTWKSTNGGVSFNVSSQWVPQYAQDENIGYCHADVDIMQFVGNTLYVGSDGGIFLAENTETVNTSYYRDITAGMGIRQLYKLGISQTPNTIISAGSQDNGTSVYNSQGEWNNWLGADGMESFVDKNNSSTLYGTSQNGRLYRSMDGGQTYTSLGSPDDKSGNWVTPFEQDPKTPNTIYSGYDVVYKSTDKGDSWTVISQNFSYWLNHLKIAPTDNQTMYASGYDKLYKTTDGGQSDWAEISGVSGYINSIAIHPTNPLKVAIASNSDEKVYVTHDGGNTWTAQNAGLPNFSPLCLVWQDNGKDGLYLGMNYGIYYIDNTLEKWRPFDKNLPNVQINELEINTSNHKMYAATYGRGVWESTVYSIPQIERDVCLGASFTYADGTIADNILKNESHQSILAGKATNGLDSLVVENLNIVEITKTLNQSNGTLSASHADASYQWLDCNNDQTPISGYTSRSFTPSASGSYAVEITHKGCTSVSLCENVEVLGVLASTFENQILLYPNPSNGLMLIDFDAQIAEVNIEIRNISGQLLKQFLIQNTQKAEINLNYPNGIYLIDVTSGRRHAKFKVLKK